jgi:hypothetical protein
MAVIMHSLPFLSCVSLPMFQGLPLAVTATRALERFSDLATGDARLAPMKAAARIDVMDECLDLVVPNAELLAGFEFTGLSLAEYRAALAASGQPSALREAVDAVLRGSDVEALRHAARQRIKVCAPYTHLRQCRLWLPDRYADQPMLTSPMALQGLSACVFPGQTHRRNRYTVEMLETAGLPGRRLPRTGKRFPVRHKDTLAYIVWEDQRLQPAPELGWVEVFERQLALPSLESSYFSNHFRARNVFAHFRASRFVDAEGRCVMLLDEVQSDWMRDLRLQRQGRPLPKRWTHIGQHRGRVPEQIPECPVEKAWLAVTLDAYVEFARSQGADLVAWTPGVIQHELNPGLPRTTAERLYDKNVATFLKTSVGDTAECGLETVEYPTYKRNVLVRGRRGGYHLVKPDGKTQVSEHVPDKETVLGLYRARAMPTVEYLPAYWLVPGINEYKEIDDLEILDSDCSEHTAVALECQEQRSCR